MSKNQMVWLVGRYLDEYGENEGNWAVEGIFTTRDKAAAIAEPGWFIAGGVPLDEHFAPGDVVDFPDVEVFQ